MASFAEFTKKKKKQSLTGDMSFRDYTETMLGIDLDDIAPVRTTVEPISTVSAPVKEEKEDKLDFFQKGAKIGDKKGFWNRVLDVPQAILGTGADAGVGVVKGVLGIGEGIKDLGQYGVAGVADLVGADKFADNVRKNAQKNTVEESFKGVDDYLDQYSVLGRTSDSIMQGVGQVGTIILTGGVGASAGLGAVGTTALTTGVMGASSAGSGMSEAYRGGATDGEAVAYGLAKGAIDAGTELMFGGLGKAVGAVGLSKGILKADDIFAQKLSSKISNQVAKNMVEFGVKASGEGLEELVAGVGSAFMKSVTYMDEEEWNKIIEDENLLEQFVVGTVTSGMIQSGYIPKTESGSLKEANATGRDFITGYTQNEQAVIDKVVEERVKEQETDGKKLDKKEIGKIEKEVASDLQKGYISVDTIESVLGGESFKAYNSLVEQENTLKKEIEALENMPNEKITVKENERLKQAREELNTLLEKSDKDGAKQHLTEEVNKLIENDTFLKESYNEKNRRSQQFEADLTKYDEKQKAVIQKAVESGILNNTNKTHEFVDMIAKLSADKGVLFDFTNNDRLKESGFAIEGKTINGYVKDGNIALNINSQKALNTVVGHEITHVLEGTELYTELQTVITEYAKTKGDYDSRLEAITRLYEGVENVNLENEITADLVGDYLFTDSDFINNLSTKKPNVFKKIYDEIKYFLKIATAGSKEAKQLEQVKRAFDKAYKETANKTTSSEVSISMLSAEEVTPVIEDAEKVSMELTKEQQDYFKKSKVRDESGNLKVMYHGTSKGGHTVFDPYGASKYGLFGVGTYFTDNKSVAESYTEKGKGNNKQIYETYLNITNPIDMDAQANPEAWKKALPEADFRESGTNEQFYRDMEEYLNDQEYPRYEAIEIAFDVIESMGYDGITHIGGGRFNKKDDTRHQVYIAFYPKQIKNIDNSNPTENADIRYSLSEDSEGHALSKEQKEYFRDSKIVDENGQLMVLYHQTDADFTEFDTRHEGAGSYDHETPYGVFLKPSSSDIGIKGQKQMPLYALIKNPLQVKNRAELVYQLSQDEAYNNLYNDQKNVDREYKAKFENAGKEFQNYIVEWRKNNPDASRVAIYDDAGFQELYENEDKVVEEWTEKSNEVRVKAKERLTEYLKEKGYDGLIIEEDAGSFGRSTKTIIAFNSNQVKSVDNATPTDNPDINLSLSGKNDIAPTGKYNVYGKDIALETVSKTENVAPVVQEKTDLVQEVVQEAPKESKATQTANRLLGIVANRDIKKHTALVEDYQKVQLAQKAKDIVTESNGDNKKLYELLLSEKKKVEENLKEIYAIERKFEANKGKMPDYVHNMVSTARFHEDMISGMLYDLRNIGKLRNQQTYEVILEYANEARPSIKEEYAPMTEAEANERDAMQSDRLYSLNESDMPEEVEAPYSEPIEAVSPFDDKDIQEVGDRKQKAYMYENPEVKPYFQEEAQVMLGELRNSVKGERVVNADLVYESGGEFGVWGTKRETSEQIAYMLDRFKYSYADIEKGLNAIIEDHGAENNAISKRLEFMIDERLREGYTDFLSGMEIPSNQDYINLLRDKQINNYSDEAYNQYLESLAEQFRDTTEMIEAPTQAYEAIEPEPQNLDTLEAQWAKNKMARADSKKEAEEIAKILDAEPTTESKRNSRKWAIFKANVFDKGAVFEDLALKTKNRELMGKWNYTLYSESRAQRLMGEGDAEAGIKSLYDIRAEVENTGLSHEFSEYIYHKHNVDRMKLEERYGTEENPVKNKPVFGYSVTAEMSQEIVDQYEFAQPQFMDFANDLYKYNTYLRQQLVDNGVISQETADLWNDMYPHYVPIRRINTKGLNINVPLDTGRTGVNAPVKGATGGNANILPLFDTMAMRTLQTYKATAKNSFGVELKNSLGTVVDKQNTNVDEVIESIDGQEELLQEGKNGQKPTFTVFENGERVTYEITEDMYDALKPLSDSNFMSKTIKPLNVASNFHRGLLTEYNPVFIITNGIKDIQDVLINSQHPARTYTKIPEAFAQLTKKGYWYNEYMNNGGDYNSYFDSDTNTFKTENKGLAKLLDLPPLSTISKLNNYVEMVPRLAEYIASREAGRSVEVSMLDSARVTTNFRAGGDLTKWANRNGATFLNASVQGAMQQVRNVREAKANGMKGWANLATKFALAGAPAYLLNALLWADDDEYEELSDYVKQNYYIVGKYDDGKFIRIPKGRTVAVIQDAIKQVSDISTGNGEEDLKSFLELVVTNLAPANPIENNIVAPIIQVKNNETWYGEDLVPTRLQDLPASEQFDESTDSVSKWLGEKLDISPVKINYLLDQYSGGLGDVVLPMLTPEAESGDNSPVGNMIAPLKKKFTVDSVINNQNVSDLYDTSEELTTNAKMSTATDEDILKNKYINSVKGEMSDLYKQKREIQSSDLPDDVKYERVREIQSEIVALSKEGLKSYKGVQISGDYATVGDRHYKRDDNGEWKKLTDKQLEKQEEVTNGLGISSSEYWGNKDEYDFAYEKPEKYAMSKVVGGYDTYKQYTSELYDIKADKDENGKTISGSRKEKVLNYVSNLNVDYGTKIILYKSEYNADDTYNYDIVEYLNNRSDISYEEEVEILKSLGFTVDTDGTISW